MKLSFRIVFIQNYFGLMIPSITINRYLFFLTIGSLLFVFVACSNSYVDDIDRGGGYKYKPGYPELRVVASGFIDQNDDAFINIASEIVYGSLVFKKRDSIYVARAFINYQILDLDNPQNIIETKEYPILITDRSNRLSYDQSTYKVERNFEVHPGNFKIVTSITDENTGKQISRTSNLFIPDPTEDVNNITNIRIFTKKKLENSGYISVATYDVQNDIDSIKFVFQITNNKSTKPLTINTKLLKFEADTTIARPMNYNNYTPSSIQYKGIDYSEEEEINSNRRVLTNQGNVSIEFTFPKLERGNYRFEVFSDLGEENELYKARDFSIKSSSYPSLSTARELARPLYYLMSKKEYEQLMAIENDLELKKAIDRFWLKNIGNSQIAKNVIELYYERVEEANKQFSNFKEGWKTDQGMMYILFGPPWYVDAGLKTKVWSYSYTSQDPTKNFYFTTPRLNNKFFPFDNYLLERGSFYYNVMYQQIDFWRTGLILQRDL